MKNPGAKGARLERKSKQWLEARGFWVCRAAGSKGLWDLVAINKTSTLLVQVKASKQPGPAERKRLEDFQSGPFVIKEIHVWLARATEPEVHFVNNHLEQEMNPLQKTSCGKEDCQ